jgi:hypothetical protein
MMIPFFSSVKQKTAVCEKRPFGSRQIQQRIGCKTCFFEVTVCKIAILQLPLLTEGKSMVQFLYGKHSNSENYP